MPEFTMQAVSQETGVPDDTLRSWERRYGFPAPSRDDSNYGIYSERDIIAVAWLRDQTHRGQGISEAIAMLRRILESTPDRRVSKPLAATPPPLSPVTTLTDALLAGDLAAAQASWDGLAATVSPDGLLEHVLLPAYARVGEAPLSLTDRLRADAFLQRKAIVLFDAASPDRGSRDVAIVVLGAHSLTAAFILGTALARDGFRITLPIADLSYATTLAALRDLPEGCPVVLVTEHPDTSLIDAADAVLAPRKLDLWWPVDASNLQGERWLPTALNEVRHTLTGRA